MCHLHFALASSKANVLVVWLCVLEHIWSKDNSLCGDVFPSQHDGVGVLFCEAVVTTVISPLEAWRLQEGVQLPCRVVGARCVKRGASEEGELPRCRTTGSFRGFRAWRLQEEGVQSRCGTGVPSRQATSLTYTRASEGFRIEGDGTSKSLGQEGSSVGSCGVVDGGSFQHREPTKLDSLGFEVVSEVGQARRCGVHRDRYVHVRRYAPGSNWHPHELRLNSGDIVQPLWYQHTSTS